MYVNVVNNGYNQYQSIHIDCIYIINGITVYITIFTVFFDCINSFVQDCNVCMDGDYTNCFFNSSDCRVVVL